MKPSNNVVCQTTTTLFATATMLFAAVPAGTKNVAYEPKHSSYVFPTIPLIGKLANEYPANYNISRKNGPVLCLV